MHRRSFLKIVGGAGAGLSMYPKAVLAETPWPNKPVKIIVPFGAGGGTDVLARYYAEKLSQAFGQSFVVENRGGASGMIGTEAAAKSKPDGYTLLLSSNTSTINLPLLRNTPYDHSSLVPIVRVGDGVSGFCVHPSTGLNSLKDLVEYAKANPGKLSFGTPGPGTSGHMRMEMLSYRAGIKFLHVPYRGGGEVLTDFISGIVQVANDPINNPSAKAGKLKMLCMNHTTRNPEFPDVPTLTESGYPNSDMPLWYCIYAPTGVPQNVVDVLHAKVTEISKLPETAVRIKDAGMMPVTSTRSQLFAFRDSEIKTTKEIIKFADIKLE